MNGKTQPLSRIRMETDLLGERAIPADFLYGIHTARAVENFPISGRRLADEPALLRALALLKRAAARANARLGRLPAEEAGAICEAADEVADGLHAGQFVVDLMEGAGGTSLNMNVNEVLANRALQLLGDRPGHYARIHPNDHVNQSQSTNDVIPSAILIACHGLLGEAVESLEKLRRELQVKQEQFSPILRLGRTCLQDAQPMTLGQSFGAYAALAERLARALAACRDSCRAIPVGGTAIGTGLGSVPGFAPLVLEELRERTGVGWTQSADLFDGLSNADVYARISGELRTAATALGKVANDLQLLSSGPHGGLAELRLPAVQAGSSIMPGKINPVIPMSVCQVGFAVTGYDVIVAVATQQGQLEINPYEPVIAAHLLASIRLVTGAVTTLHTRCIAGIVPDAPRMLAHLTNSSALATVLVPRLGYDAVSRLVRDAEQQGVTLLETLVAQGQLSVDEARGLLERAASGHS